MRIVSLLPSLTELVCALGHRESLVGVTHECDFPPGVESLPHLTRTRIPAAASSQEIDTLVASQGGSLYELDGDRLAALRPDLILTQAQCDVCAVNEDAVRSCARTLPGGPTVESVNPTDWSGVAAMFRRVGQLLGVPQRGEALVDDVDHLARTIRDVRKGRSPATVALLEWLDPPYIAGHWIPDLIAMAGGRDVLGQSGEASRRATWQEIAEADPEVLLLSPCGFAMERSQAELSCVVDRPEWPGLRAVRADRVFLIDGNAYFSRPGPRLRDSLAIAAAAIAPEEFGASAPTWGWRKLSLSE